MPMVLSEEWEMRRTVFGTLYWVDLSCGALTLTDPTKVGADSPVEYLNDLTQLPAEQLTSEAITDAVSRRYAAGLVYTWAGAQGNLLVAVNPFRPLSIYTESYAQQFLDSVDVVEGIAPHTFAVAAAAYRDLGNVNQALLVQGESGSGKTETAKHCLALLAQTAGNSDGVLEQKVLAANPVLEAFGNAFTARNNNSSRFGKWIQLRFSDEGHIASAKIDTCMLEKSRVSTLVDGQCNYHIFEYLVRSRKSLPKELELLSADEFRYLRPAAYAAGRKASASSVARQDDKDQSGLLEVMQSLAQLGFSKQDSGWLWRMMAVVLHLGNLKFEKGRDAGGNAGSRFATGSPSAVIARLLGVSVGDLERSLVTKAIEVRGEVMSSPLKPEAARGNADALARTIHGRIFAWLVRSINGGMVGDGVEDEDDSFIGIFDIFGFEIFEVNSFEQLCINWANERLQQHLFRAIFGEERHLHEDEGVELGANFAQPEVTRVLGMLEGIWAPAPGSDPMGATSFFAPPRRSSINVTRRSSTHIGRKRSSVAAGGRASVAAGGDRVSVSAGRARSVSSFAVAKREQITVGLLPLLDDVCKLPDASERKFVERSMAEYKAFDCWSLATPGDLTRFTVVHYAGVVTYSVDGFIEKNKDQQMLAHHRLLRASTFELCRDLLPTDHHAGMTTYGALRTQLNDLLDTIGECAFRCVCCVKPNAEKAPNAFDPVFGERQLRCGGIFDVVKMRKFGFPFRMDIKSFVNLYRCVSLAHPCWPCATQAAPWASMPPAKEAAAAILDFVGAKLTGGAQPDDSVTAAIGQTMVFTSGAISRTLELLRMLAIEHVIPRIVHAIRRYMGWKFREAIVDANDALKEAASKPDSLVAQRLAVDAAQSSLLQLFGYQPRSIDEVEGLCKDLQKRADITAKMLELTSGGAAQDKLGFLMTLLAQSAELSRRGVERTAEQAEAEEAAKALARASGGPLLEKQIARALNLPIRDVLEGLVSKAAVIDYASASLEEVDRMLSLPEVDFVKLQLEKTQSSGLSQVAQDLRVQLAGSQAEQNPLAFTLERWPTLRDSRAWLSTTNIRGASARWRLGKMDEVDRLETMIRFQDYPIHAALLEKTTVYNWGQAIRKGWTKHTSNREAMALFGNILGYMGERQHPYPDTLAVELVNSSVASLPLASEAFAQLLKQLTENPSTTSMERGWELFALLCDHACPSASDEVDLVAGFAWLNAPRAIRVQLLDALFQQQSKANRASEQLELADVRQSVMRLWQGGGRPTLTVLDGRSTLQWSSQEELEQVRQRLRAERDRQQMAARGVKPGARWEGRHFGKAKISGGALMRDDGKKFGGSWISADRFTCVMGAGTWACIFEDSRVLTGWFAGTKHSEEDITGWTLKVIENYND